MLTLRKVIILSQKRLAYGLLLPWQCQDRLSALIYSY